MRTVYACSLRFPADVADSIWTEVTDWIAGWYAQNSPKVHLPIDWASGNNGALVIEAGHLLDVRILTLKEGAEGPLREVRWRYPDAKDSSLLWSSEVTVHVGNDTLLTLTLKIAGVDFEILPAKYQLGTPRLIRSLVGRGIARVGEHPMNLTPHRVEADAVEPLVELLLSPTRQHPVIVLSPDPYTEMPCVVPSDVSRAVAGLATVYVLSSRWAGFALTDELGRQYSCYNGAARIYWPRFSRSADPFFHRLWMPGELLTLGETFASSLLRILAAAASFRFVEPASMRAFRLRHEEARLAAVKASTSGDYEALFDEYAKLDNEARQLREGLETATKDNETLRENISAVRAVVAESTASMPKVAIVNDRPDLKNVHDAVIEAQTRTTHLVYIEDAFSSALDSPFKQPDKAYSALMAIDDVARVWAGQFSGGPSLARISHQTKGIPAVHPRLEPV